MYPFFLTILYILIIFLINMFINIQRSLYFKITHGTKKMWSYIAGGLKIKVI